MLIQGFLFFLIFFYFFLLSIVVILNLINIFVKSIRHKTKKTEYENNNHNRN